MKKIILDVDTGVDDAIAIMLGIGDPTIEIIGITTVTGNVGVDRAFENSCRIVRYFGQEQKIPVYYGARENLFERSVRAFEVHGEDGLNGMLPDLSYNNTKRPAITWLIEQIKKFPNEITFVGTAPITNLALAVKLAPEIIPLIKEVILMTGAFEFPGNVTSTAEFNAYADPIALQIILDTGFQSLKLIGLDVTTKVLLSQESINKIQDPETCDFLLALTSNYRKLYQRLYNLNGCAMHDPLALGIAIDASFCGFEHVQVSMELKGEHTYGQTVLNRHTKNKNALVATSVETERVINYLVSQLNRLKIVKTKREITKLH
ncbi:MAG: nucleoside hydrolase [Deltaproteobacteria bacterium]|nr:nucleoside hydrolase [Deltaproteobacteria bacterium]MBT4526608.1 nucleoside hydrolase [Deltaproteobacteria bacterium]